MLYVVARGRERRRLGLQRAAADFIHFHAEFGKQIAHLGPLEDNANRTRDRVAARDDVVRRDPGEISRGRGNRAKNGRHRLLLGELAQVEIKRFAAYCRTAWAIDRHDHCLDMAVLAQLFQKLVPFPAVADKAADRYPRDVIASKSGERLAISASGGKGDGRHNGEDRQYAPNRKPAP